MESIITFTSQQILQGILHTPKYSIGQNKKILVLFLHGWAGYRTGPHDMFVKQARQLCDLGFYCIRFDFGGKGYSQETSGETNLKSMIRDLQAVLNEINNRLLADKIILLGICSGSNVGINYIMFGNYKIDNLIELSAPRLWQENKTSVEVRQVRYNLITYFKKMFRSETWQKLFTNSLNYKNITYNIFKPIIIIFSKYQNVIVQNKKKFRPEDLQQLKPFANFNGQILAIHGEKDPDTPAVCEQLKNICRQYNIPLSLTIIKDANHSFYSVKWEQKVIGIVNQWLMQRYKS